MQLADSHLHLFRQGFAHRYGPAFARSNEVELYNAFRRAHGIVAGLVVGYEGMRRFRGNNRDLARWRKSNPWIKPVAYVPVAPAPSLAALDSWRGQGFVGISIYALSGQDAERLRAWPRPLAAWLNTHRQIISINARPESLARLADFFARLEGCKILISHLGLPGAHPRPPSPRAVRARLRPLCALAGLKHVGVKISGLYAVSDPAHDYPHASARPFVERVREEFGAERLYWGSDFSPALEHVSFDQTIDPVRRFGWSEREVRGVMGENLLRLLTVG